MSNEQKETIKSLRSQGQSISQISSIIGISANTIKAFLRREHKKKEFCKFCRKLLEQLPNCKPKTYCNDTCRYAWWKANRHLATHKVIYDYICDYCKQAFTSLGKDRKYCSHPCYISARFGVP